MAPAGRAHRGGGRSARRGGGRGGRGRGRASRPSARPSRPSAHPVANRPQPPSPILPPHVDEQELEELDEEDEAFISQDEQDINDSPARRTRSIQLAASAGRGGAANNDVDDSPASRTRTQRASQASLRHGSTHPGVRMPGRVAGRVAGHVAGRVAGRPAVGHVLGRVAASVSGRVAAGRDNDNSAATRSPRRFVAPSRAAAPRIDNAAGTLRRLFGNASGDDDDDDNYELEEDNSSAEPELPAVVVPLATGREEQVHYGTRLTNVGRDWLLEKCVKEHVFPKQKFAKLIGDLDFSNNPNSICRFMAEKMKVKDEDVESWWENSKKAVDTKLRNHRNNVIKMIKTKLHGKNRALANDHVLLCSFSF